MKIDEVSNASNSVPVETVTLKKITVKCCNRQCLKHLLEENEASLRVFLEEWLQLEKKQQQAVLHFTIRLCSHWSTKTVRGLKRQLNRFEFEDPILGSLCRKAYATILGIGEATLTRHITVVHQSGGRFAPSAHKSEGQDGHHQLPSQIREFVIKFLVNIAEWAKNRLGDIVYEMSIQWKRVPQSPKKHLWCFFPQCILCDCFTASITRR
jgi:hypothetical protein